MSQSETDPDIPEPKWEMPIHMPAAVPRFYQMEVRDVLALTLHFAGIGAAIYHCGLTLPPSSILTLTGSILITQILATTPLLSVNRLFIALYTIAATILAAAPQEHKVYFALPNVITMLIHSQKIQINGLWLMLNGMFIPSQLAGIIISSTVTAQVGFEDEEDMIQRINTLVMSLEKDTEHDATIPEPEKPRLLRILREIRNCTTSRNKLGASLAVVKAQSEYSDSESDVYAQVLHECRKSIKVAQFETKAQQILQTLANLMAGSAIIGGTIKTTMGLDNISVCHHMFRRPMPSAQAAPPPLAPGAPDNDAPIPYSSYVKTIGSEKMINQDDVATIAANAVNAATKWTNAATPVADKLDREYKVSNSRYFGYDVVHTLLNATKEPGQRDTAASGTPTALTCKTYAQTMRKPLLKIITRSDSRDLVEAAGALLVYASWASEVGTQIGENVLGSGRASTVLAKGPKFATKLQEISTTLRNMTITMPEHEYLAYAAKAAQIAMSDILNESASALSKPSKLFYPRGLIKALKRALETSMSILSDPDTADAAVEQAIGAELKSIEDILDPVEIGLRNKSQDPPDSVITVNADDFVQ